MPQELGLVVVGDTSGNLTFESGSPEAAVLKGSWELGTT